MACTAKVAACITFCFFKARPTWNTLSSAGTLPFWVPTADRTSQILTIIRSSLAPSRSVTNGFSAAGPIATSASWACRPTKMLVRCLASGSTARSSLMPPSALMASPRSSLA